MSDLITVSGVVISSMPVGEYDRRVVLLTRERGKISAFAKGARRVNSPMIASTSPFVFGNFTLYEGRSSYNLNQVEVTYNFLDLANEQPGVYYGYYFLELAEYFGRENTDEKEMMNLLFITVKALLAHRIDNRLIRCIFELRTMVIQGLMPEIYACTVSGEQIPDGETAFFSQENHGLLCSKHSHEIRDSVKISPTVLYTLRYICSAPLEQLYAFTIGSNVLFELEKVVNLYVEKNTDRRFKSLEILRIMAS